MIFSRVTFASSRNKLAIVAAQLSFLPVFMGLSVIPACAAGHVHAQSLSAKSDATKAALPNAASSNEMLHCWRLEQFNAIFGECTIYACPTALKIVFKNGKWIDLCKAPDWELYVLNPAEKIYFHTPLDKWQANRVQVGLFNASTTSLVRTKIRQKIAGQTAVQLLPANSTNPNASGSYWVAENLHFPEQIYHVLCGNAFLPKLQALPLRVCLNVQMIKNSVDTRSCKQVDMPRSFFDMPSGFRVAKTDQEVMDAGVMDVVRDMTGF